MHILNVALMNCQCKAFPLVAFYANLYFYKNKKYISNDDFLYNIKNYNEYTVYYTRSMHFYNFKFSINAHKPAVYLQL